MTELLPEFRPFVQAEIGMAATDASERDRRLIALLAKHGEDEGEILAAYERYAREAESPAVRYLVQLIMDDERRHHRVLGEIANAIAWGDAATPVGTNRSPALGHVRHDPELRAATEQLLAYERRDAQELAELRESFRDVEGSTVWALLIDLMMHDTAKHARILEFISDHS